MDEQARSHSHGHGHHSFDQGWVQWRSGPGLRLVLIALVAAAVATAGALWVLWPNGTGRDAAIAQATEFGLAAERLEAVVATVTDGPCSYSSAGDPQECRSISVIPASGPDAGAILFLGEFSLLQPGLTPDVSLGDQIIIGFEPATESYFYADRDRRLPLAALTALFALVVLALGRFRGLLALAAMAVTLAVLVGFVAPSVLDGNDPLLVSVVGASAIAFVALYLTHGFNPTTTVALAGTLGALVLTLAISWFFFEAANFTGLATEEGLTIPIVADGVNLSSLLLGGAIIGALGALDDVTVTQVATVSELAHRNPELSRRELVISGIRVGREHIASTVNTLLLAYAGASMPLLLLFAVTNQSLDIVANSELLAVEIVRTLCGSIGLVAAVPVTTALAAVIVAPRHSVERPDPAPTEPTSALTWADFAPDENPDL